jgi:hypothetical protein
MRKFILFLVIGLVSLTAMAADVWSFKLTRVTRSNGGVSIDIVTLVNDTVYDSANMVFKIEDVQNLTIVQFKEKIKEQAQYIVNTYHKNEYNLKKIFNNWYNIEVLLQ